MNRLLIAALLLAALAGCATPNVNLGVSFDAAAAQRQLADGPNTVRGSALIRQQGGGVVTCAGLEVSLIPATRYAERLYEVLYGTSTGGGMRVAGPVTVEPRSDDFGRLVRRATCDAQGNFVFERVTNGEWFAETVITWRVGNAFTPQGGALMRRLSVSGGNTATVVLAP